MGVMVGVRQIIRTALAVLATGLLLASPAFAQVDSGDTAWILTATALVLFMTLPGLALFYGGLVQSKNVLSVLMQCFAVACLMSVLWLAVGYSIAFGGEGPYWGGLGKSFLNGVTDSSLSGTLPEGLFFAFQMTFAIITPALMIGAFVERVKFSAVLIFCAIWLVLVYAPVAHWVWGGGWLATRGVTDFAGGIVVHATAGVSALVFAIMLGKRGHFPRELRPPHNPGYVMLGAAMLWVGWFGFNAGSAVAADASAARAMLVTHTSAATAALVWMMIEWVSFKKPTLVGIATGTIAGLATITPAAGSVGPVAALIIGAAAAVICYGAVVLIRTKLKIDDSLDVFAVHGVGGILGTLLIPFLASVGPMAPGLGETSVGAAFGAQLTGVLAVSAYSIIVTVIVLMVLKVTIGLRVSEEQEEEGLDTASHGESAYHF
jgi:Amt family ammonium transporter